MHRAYFLFLFTFVSFSCFCMLRACHFNFRWEIEKVILSYLFLSYTVLIPRIEIRDHCSVLSVVSMLLIGLIKWEAQGARWAEYFSEILNRRPPETEPDIPVAVEDLDVETMRSQNLPYTAMHSAKFSIFCPLILTCVLKEKNTCFIRA